MSVASKQHILFELYAQNKDDSLIIKNLEQNNFFQCTVKDLLANPKLLTGFSSGDINFIKQLESFV